LSHVSLFSICSTLVKDSSAATRLSTWSISKLRSRKGSNISEQWPQSWHVNYTKIIVLVGTQVQREQISNDKVELPGSSIDLQTLAWQYFSRQKYCQGYIYANYLASNKGTHVHPLVVLV
jgi:hypothetical protein